MARPPCTKKVLLKILEAEAFQNCTRGQLFPSQARERQPPSLGQLPGFSRAAGVETALLWGHEVTRTAESVQVWAWNTWVQALALRGALNPPPLPFDFSLLSWRMRAQQPSLSYIRSSTGGSFI